MDTTYLVQWADWLPVEEDQPEDMTDEEWASLPESECSNEIDARTCRSKSFTTESEAVAFATEKLHKRQGDKWLAYVEVKKCSIELLKKLK